jgi:hypothetical protein
MVRYDTKGDLKTLLSKTSFEFRLSKRKALL